MRKFYMIMLAVLMCVAGTAMAKPSANDGTPQKGFTTKKQLQVFSGQTGMRVLEDQPVKNGFKVLSNAQQPPLRLTARRAPATATELAGYYVWTWQQASELVQTPESTTEGTTNVTITATSNTALKISGMFPNDLSATYNATTGTITITPQTAGTSSYGNYQARGCYYYEGDDEKKEGFYLTSNIIGNVDDEGVIKFDDGIIRYLSSGTYAGQVLTPYWLPGSTLTPSEPPTVVVLPEGVELVEYAMSYTDASNKPQSGPAAVAVDGNDVYFQGFSQYLPDALVKGTKNGNIITVPTNQFLGSYANMDDYLYTSITFTYDEEANTYTATGEVYSVLGDQYYDFRGYDPVLKGIVEKAATPANPEITALTNSNYGYYIEFNIPLEDTEGDPLLASKLSYQLFTDVEGDINPITFTSKTHMLLTEDMSIIPYGFTEGYDFYNGEIYLNELFSDEWNKIGIKSIYTGGGETNETEIQWYTIKEYGSVIVNDIYYQVNKEDYTAQVTGCASTLTNLNIPETINVTSGTYTGTYVVTSVADNAFFAGSNNNKTITSVTIPSTITKVGTDAFRNQSNLKTLNIADLESWIAIEFANGNANPLYNVFPTSTSQWGKVYIAGEEVTDLVIPEGVAKINRSFYGFKALKSVTLPSTLTYIEAQAFNACEGLTEITFPASLTNIGNMAFYGAKNIEKVTCYATVPPTCGYMNFTNFSSKAPLYVPTESVEAYHNASEWKDFTNIIGVDVPVETIGTYTMNIQPTDIYATRESEPAEITVEVQKQGQTYYLVETGETNYFKGQKAPFTYNQTTGMATFEQTYVGKTDDESFAEYPYLWSAGFVATTMAEPQPQFAVPFDVENGFDFSGNTNAGIAWYGSNSETEFAPVDVYAAFFGALSEVAETVGTYTWSILPTTMAGEKTSEADVVEIEVEVKKQGDNYWIAEAGTTNYFNDQIIPFTYNDATKYAEFTSSYAGEVDGNHIWFSAFIYNAGGFTEPQPTYTAKFTAENGFEFTSGDAGFAWYITENADEFNPMDVYKAFYVNPTFEVEEGDYGDASIEGEWEFTINDHYAGSSSRNVVTDKYTATLDGNTVTFVDEWEDAPIIAKFTAENTLTFNLVAVSDLGQYPQTQSPFIAGPTTTVEEVIAEDFTFASFSATYDPEAGTITFPEGCGLVYGNAKDGVFSYYTIAFDFISAKKATGEDNPGTSINAIDAANANADAIFYDLNGRRVNTPKAGLYIMKSGNTVQKVVVE